MTGILETFTEAMKDIFFVLPQKTYMEVRASFNAKGGECPSIPFGTSDIVSGVVSAESKEQLNDLQQKFEELGLATHNPVFSDAFVPSYNLAFETRERLTHSQEKDLIKAFRDNGLTVNNISDIGQPLPSRYKLATQGINSALHNQGAYSDPAERTRLDTNYTGIYMQSRDTERPADIAQTNDGVDKLSAPFSWGMSRYQAEQVKDAQLYGPYLRNMMID